VTVVANPGGYSLTRDGTILPPGLPPGPYVWDARTALAVPAVDRAVQLYGGMCKQMPIDAYRSGTAIPRPRLLDAPDPGEARSWFVQVSIEDYLLNGNALCYVTVRGADGWPLAVQWLPAQWVYISWYPGDPTNVVYTYLGETLNVDDVIHIKRGADRFYPVRGVGVVEQHLSSLDRVAMEEDYERSTLAGAAVPSVAIITPQATLTQDVADDAKQAWMVKFGGPTREPAILPNGTQVVPLAWSPTDAQLIQARQASLIDVANMFNLDGYWLGAPVAGMTYRTAGPQYQQILRTSIEPVLADFEAVWSNAWLPRGTTIRFDRNQLLRDDLLTTAQALQMLVTSGIMSPAEARDYLALPSMGGGDPTTLTPGLAVPQQVPADTGQPAQPGSDQGGVP